MLMNMPSRPRLQPTKRGRSWRSGAEYCRTRVRHFHPAMGDVQRRLRSAAPAFPDAVAVPPLQPCALFGEQPPLRSTWKPSAQRCVVAAHPCVRDPQVARGTPLHFQCRDALLGPGSSEHGIGHERACGLRLRRRGGSHGGQNSAHRDFHHQLTPVINEPDRSVKRNRRRFSARSPVALRRVLPLPDCGRVGVLLVKLLAIRGGGLTIGRDAFFK